MIEELQRPRLRPVDAFPVEQDGQTMIAVSDPMSYAEHAILVPPHAFFLITLMDGQHTVEEMQGAFAEQFEGVRLPLEQIRDLVRSLDKGCFLDTAEARARMVEVEQAFREAEVRPAWHDGQAYPGEPDALTKELDGYYRDDDGAGLVGEGAGTSSAVSAVLVPHIDLRAGGACYTHGYRPLFEEDPADLYVILGVAHYGDGSFFVGTGKDFETPLGRVRTARELVSAWTEEASLDVCEGQIAHRTEHSIEFQLLFLQHGLNKRPFEILPVLCGSLEPYLAADKRPEEIEESGRLLEALRTTLSGYDGRVRYVVSVDLAHVGPKFGDPEPIDDDAARRHEELDRALLESAVRGDAAGLFLSLQQDMNARRVDAASALYTLLYLNPGLRGELVAYGQNRQPDTGSMVSFGSMLFRSE